MIASFEAAYQTGKKVKSAFLSIQEIHEVLTMGRVLSEKLKMDLLTSAT
jgi:hypothetical protein